MSSPTFFAWLSQQISRSDPIGVFARYAVKDKIFPKTAKHLYLYLLRYEGLPAQREGVKLAHAEWRKTRRRKSEGAAA